MRRAHATAAERLERAVAEDAATIAQAEKEAALILEQARQEGISEASVLVAAQRTRSRRQARAVMLRARAEVVEELRRRSIAAAARLSTEPGYPEVRNRLVDYVRAQLGEEAVISDAPTGGHWNRSRTTAGLFLRHARRAGPRRASHSGQLAMNDMTPSRVTRVVGPLVQLDVAASLAMSDVVRLGPSGLPGEVVAIRDGSATVQAYEYTGGCGPAIQQLAG